jgi:catechol 2,3-dioxygenase-like lactoylglutathione lyase family enzyme
MIQVRRLGHASFSTPDLYRQVEYYADVLGLRILERDTERAYFATRTGLEAIALERGDAVALKRLSFQVAPGSDLAALARELSDLGITSERRSDISPGIADALVFADIKGTLIELFADYAFADDDGVQAVITPLKLGHVAYRVSDVQQVTKFYTDVLGFRVSDWRDTTFSFLRCNTDHHTVNFVVDPVPQLHHIAFEVKDWPEIHRASDFLAKNNIRLVWGPARHIIGHNIAAYHRNSDNVRVELFCEMDQMKDEALGYFDPRPWHQDRPQRPKTWDKDTLRNYWGFASHGTFPGYP